jgi:hypothetical protein
MPSFIDRSALPAADQEEATVREKRYSGHLMQQRQNMAHSDSQTTNERTLPDLPEGYRIVAMLERATYPNGFDVTIYKKPWHKHVGMGPTPRSATLDAIRKAEANA